MSSPPDTSSPSLLLGLFELRSIAEVVAGVASQPLLRSAPRGDGHPVLVIPGFLTTDFSTVFLRSFLRRQGHDVHPWALGRNVGAKDGVQDALARRLEAIAAAQGRKVSLVGQSLGGTFARALAATRPDLVRAVVTLGSPAAGSPKANNAWRVYEWVSSKSVEDALWPQVVAEPRVPTSAIWSQSDGVVSPSSARVRETELSETIRVRGSHMGMAFHPAVLLATADRLAQPEGAWRRFEAPSRAEFLYPSRQG